MAADTQPERTPAGASVLARMRPALLKYFLRKTGSPAEAEDLTQDVLIRSLTHAHWSSQEEAKGYVFRSAVNRWHDRRRKHQTQGTTVPWHKLDDAFSGTEFQPERVLIAREELNQVFRTLEGMNERTRTVLMLIRFEKTKAATVAEML